MLVIVWKIDPCFGFLIQSRDFADHKGSHT